MKNCCNTQDSEKNVVEIHPLGAEPPVRGDDPLPDAPRDDLPQLVHQIVVGARVVQHHYAAVLKGVEPPLRGDVPGLHGKRKDRTHLFRNWSALT